MQRNNQQHEQFLREFGALLTAHTRHGHAVQQPQALLHLADYVSSARRHHRLSRAALAQKTGRAEAEIYALEQGLLPYSVLDLHFLHTLATALDEDLETLLLLLGRPVLAHKLRGKTMLSPHGASLYRQPASGRSATGPQRRDNPFALAWWLNLLHKGYLNLIDSVQEGRLLGYVRHQQRVWLPMTMFVCLLCICVGTYSLLGRFDAESTSRLYLRLSTVHTLSSTSEAWLNAEETAVAFATPAWLTTHSLLSRSTAAAAEPVDDNPQAALALLGLPHTAQMARCDLRTGGRFALCRI